MLSGPRTKDILDHEDLKETNGNAGEAAGVTMQEFHNEDATAGAQRQIQQEEYQAGQCQHGQVDATQGLEVVEQRCHYRFHIAKLCKKEKKVNSHGTTE